MLNGIINLNEVSDQIQYSAGSFKINPFIDAGIGISRNKVSNFHSVASNGTEFSKMTDKTVISPSFQIGLGVSTALNELWEIKLGYRYFYGGKFKSQDYITSDPNNSNPNTPTSVAA